MEYEILVWELRATVISSISSTIFQEWEVQFYEQTEPAKNFLNVIRCSDNSTMSGLHFVSHFLGRHWAHFETSFRCQKCLGALTRRPLK